VTARAAFADAAAGLAPAPGSCETLQVMGKEAAHTVAASSIVGLLEYARARGIDGDRALEGAGLTSAALVGAEARVPHVAYNQVWQLLADASDDPEFGLHVAERLTLDTFGVVGHLVARSRTFGEALDRVVAYSRILHDAGRVELESRGDRVIVFPGCRGLSHEFPRHVAEFSAASVLVLGRAVTRTPLAAIAMRFRHPAPASVAAHARMFHVAPVFSAPETELELPRAVLQLPIPDAQPGVLTYLDAYAHDVIAKLPDDDDLVSAVERLVASELGRGVPELEGVAIQLGMTARTLQRRLGELETSYQTLIDHVRRRYAERYLADDRLAIAEVSFLVGFSEPSNFHRAFRRWTGETPAAFRAARSAR